MKRIILILCLLLSLALLFAEQAGKVKCSLNLGMPCGATLGLGLGSLHAENSESFLNIHGHYANYLWFTGVNYEIRSYNNKRTIYGLARGGIDYMELRELLIGKYEPFLLPHLVFGIGRRFKAGSNNYVFIEWDAGLKPSFTNINIGYCF